MNKAGVTLQVADLCKSWGATNVLHNINFTVEAGSFLTLLGPSGCGKSTALRLIAGLDSVSGGKILIDGVDVTDLSPARRNIGMVFQNYALFPHMSVKQNILYGLRVRKTPLVEQNRNLERVTELMGLGELLQRNPGKLSGGQQQRVALARVLVAERPLVLMDEPLSNLDAKLRVEIRSEIREINQKLGITIVYVTHDQSEALSMSDNVLLMQGGKAAQLDKPADIYANPQNVFAASFIGTPPMNLLPATMLTADIPDAVVGSTDALLVGIRPEDLRLNEKPVGLGIAGKISHKEYEGNYTLISLLLNDGTKVITSIPKADEHEVGASLYLDADASSLHFFNVNTGERVAR
ncbi:MAG: ABC transporter ATP-binding protein [Granulosicoccus sp.]